MKRLIFPLTMLLPLCLTSCGANGNNPHISKNGDLSYVGEITYENAYKEGTFDYVSSLIKSEEPFIFYLTSSECVHCVEFKEKMLDYVKSTKSLVVKTEIFEENEEDQIVYTEDFKKIYDSYQDYFFVNGQVLTPQVYIVNGETVATKVPSSRYSTSSMFSGAMNDYVYIDNVSVFSSYKNWKDTSAKTKELMTILVDKNDQGQREMYKKAIKDLIAKSTMSVALVEIDENNKQDFIEEFGSNSLQSAFAYYAGKTTDSYSFTSTFEDGINFLKQYL